MTPIEVALIVYAVASLGFLLLIGLHARHNPAREEPLDNLNRSCDTPAVAAPAQGQRRAALLARFLRSASTSPARVFAVVARRCSQLHAPWQFPVTVWKAYKTFRFSNPWWLALLEALALARVLHARHPQPAAKETPRG